MYAEEIMAVFFIGHTEELITLICGRTGGIMTAPPLNFPKAAS
jgi:hypothetical protein